MAQDPFDKFKSKVEKEFSSFKEEKNREFDDFRNKVNEEYAALLQKTWSEFEAIKAIPVPKEDKPIPPVIYSGKDIDKPIKDSPKPFDEVIPVIKPEPQPQPIAPIKEKPKPIESYFPFEFFGTNLKVRLKDQDHFMLQSCKENDIAKMWKHLSENSYDSLINDCLTIRSQHSLCDWAYLLMLQNLSNAFFKSRKNEATLLTAFLYCQSGYKMRLATSDNQLFLLYASKHAISNKLYWELNGERFYALNCNMTSLRICQAVFPNEKPLSLFINTDQKFAERPSPQRTLQSKRFKELKTSVSTNENLIEFYNTYPTSMINQDFGTRWAMYANTPMNERTKKMLYPTLKSILAGKSQLEATNHLLNFVQTAFVYEFDSVVWGRDRAFFAEETLYYPFSDCEDRSILFSRLVRDLLGLKVILIYYPGHLATAVHFTEHTTGDHLIIKGERYIICDPTFIGSPAGNTMTGMDNGKAKVIMLE